MTAVEKAQELYEKMLRVEYPLAAKTCALIAVDEVINCCEEYDKLPETWVTQINYWQEVKNELNKLE
jgi:hypothetical protein